jgi:hypothetical protein
MLTARDGSAQGGGGTDGFRINITDQNGNVVYDNMAGVATNNDNTTANVEKLGGGSNH